MSMKKNGSIDTSDLALPDNYLWNAGTFVVGVAFLPGLGAFFADMSWASSYKKPSTMRDTPLKFDSARQTLTSHFKDLKEETNPRPQCSCPKQIEMDDQSSVGPKGKACLKHTDAECNAATFPCRPPAILFVCVIVIGGLLESRAMLSTLIFGCVCYALFCAVVGWVLLCLCRSKSGVPSTGVAMSLAYVSRIKHMEQLELEQAQGACEKAKIILGRIRSYFSCWCRAIFCCEGLKVNHILMLAKVLFIMILTEIMMPLSIVIYVVLRCAIASVTWRACSLIGLVEEVSVCGAIKKRLATMNYPGLSPTSGTAKADAPKPDVEAGCCLAACSCSHCRPACGCCPVCCDLCSLSCAICSPCCQMGCDFAIEDLCWDMLSGLLIILKAEYYTTKIIHFLQAGESAQASK